MLTLVGVGDDQEHDLVERADGVPQERPCPQRPLDLLAAHVDVGDGPVVDGLSEILWGTETSTLLARTAALPGLARWGRSIEGGVALGAGDDVSAGEVAAGRAGLGAVAAEDERVVGQPADHLLDHLLAQVEQGAAVALAVAAHVDGQADRLATRERPDAHGENDQVQAVGEDGPLTTRAEGIAEVASTVHLAAGLVEEGVVEVHDQALGAFEVADEQRCQPAPEMGHVPPPRAQEAVVGVVGAAGVRIGDVHHAGDGAAARAEHAASDQGDKTGPWTAW